MVGQQQQQQHSKPLVLNTPMHQSSPSPGIYSHYHHPAAQGTTTTGSAQGGPSSVHQPTGIRGPRGPKPANLDLRRTGSHYQTANVSAAPTVAGNGGGNSQRNTPSTNSTESNNSPNSVTGGAVSGGPGMDHNRGGGGGGYYPAPNASGGGPQHHSGHPLVMHQPLMGSPANPVGGHPGMYVKLGQTYFPHVSSKRGLGGCARAV